MLLPSQSWEELDALELFRDGCMDSRTSSFVVSDAPISDAPVSLGNGCRFLQLHYDHTVTAKLKWD